MTESSFSGDISIYLAEGEYNIEDTIEFSSVDSGSFLKPLKIIGEGNVVLKESVSLNASDFEAIPDDISQKIIDKTAAGKIKRINLNNCGITDLGEISKRGHDISEKKTPQGELYINGKRGIIARYPNSGWLSPDSFFKADDSGSVTKIESSDTETKGNGFYLSEYAERMKKWKNPENAWVSGSLRANFAYDYIPVTAFDGSTGAVTVGGSVKNYYSKSFFYFENVLEEIDCENEYYIDYDSGYLYAYLPENVSDIEFSTGESAILKFTDAENISIENIELAYGRGTAVTAKNVKNIDFDNLRLHGFGKNGIEISAAEFTTVEGSHIYDIGENAVTVGGGDYANLYGSGNLIYNNEIHDFAQLERSYRSGVYVSYRSVGVEIKNNYIYNSPHAAIIFYGVNHRIENNELENCVTDFHDMDAIYCNISEFPWERGTIIKGNYFHNIGNKTLGEKQMNVAAIRTDNQGHGLTITENLFYNIGKGRTNAVSGVRAQGTYNRIYYNMFVDSSEAYNSYPTYNENGAYKENATISNGLNTYLPVYSRFFPELSNYWNEHYSKAKTNEFKNNAVVNIAFPLSEINGKQNAEGFRGATELVDASGNFVMNKANNAEAYKAIFKNYDGGDFSIADTTLIGIENFPKINLDRIGIIR